MSQTRTAPKRKKSYRYQIYRLAQQLLQELTRPMYNNYKELCGKAKKVRARIFVFNHP